MHEFVTGVLRWRHAGSTAFVLSLTDKYPPFTLKPLDDYPVDIVVRATVRSRAACTPPSPSSSRSSAFIGLVVVRRLGDRPRRHLASWARRTAATTTSSTCPSSGGSGLLLRQLAAIPHYIVLIFVGIAAFVHLVRRAVDDPLRSDASRAGCRTWWQGTCAGTTRVNAYALGLVDRYPPFTLSPSLTAAQTAAAAWPAAPPPAAGGRLLAGGAASDAPEHRRSSPRAAAPQEPPPAAAAPAVSWLARGPGMPHTTLSRHARDPRGALAQLGERLDRTQEVSGSIPLCSTTAPAFTPARPPRRRCRCR